MHVACRMIIKSKNGFVNSRCNKQTALHTLLNSVPILGGHLKDHANNDADVLIVVTDVPSARHKYTVLIGDDTDLLKWMRVRYS